MILSRLLALSFLCFLSASSFADSGTFNYDSSMDVLDLLKKHTYIAQVPYKTDSDGNQAVQAFYLPPLGTPPLLSLLEISELLQHTIICAGQSLPGQFSMAIWADYILPLWRGNVELGNDEKQAIVSILKSDAEFVTENLSKLDAIFTLLKESNLNVNIKDFLSGLGLNHNWSLYMNPNSPHFNDISLLMITAEHWGIDAIQICEAMGFDTDYCKTNSPKTEGRVSARDVFFAMGFKEAHNSLDLNDVLTPKKSEPLVAGPLFAEDWIMADHVEEKKEEESFINLDDFIVEISSSDSTPSIELRKLTTESARSINGRTNENFAAALVAENNFTTTMDAMIVETDRLERKNSETAANTTQEIPMMETINELVLKKGLSPAQKDLLCQVSKAIHQNPNFAVSLQNRITSEDSARNTNTFSTSASSFHGSAIMQKEIKQPSLNRPSPPLNANMSNLSNTTLFGAAPVSTSAKAAGTGTLEDLRLQILARKRQERDTIANQRALREARQGPLVHNSPGNLGKSAVVDLEKIPTQQGPTIATRTTVTNNNIQLDLTNYAAMPSPNTANNSTQFLNPMLNMYHTNMPQAIHSPNQNFKTTANSPRSAQTFEQMSGKMNFNNSGQIVEQTRSRGHPMGTQMKNINALTIPKQRKPVSTKADVSSTTPSPTARHSATAAPANLNLAGTSTRTNFSTIAPPPPIKPSNSAQRDMRAQHQ